MMIWIKKTFLFEVSRVSLKCLLAITPAPKLHFHSTEVAGVLECGYGIEIDEEFAVTRLAGR